MSATTHPVATPDSLITIKLQLGTENRRFKLPLRDLGANTLPEKLRFLLHVSDSQILVLERYSDSAGAYITLDSNNASIYKQLYRAAKAKSKLRIKATIVDAPRAEAEEAETIPEPVAPLVMADSPSQELKSAQAEAPVPEDTGATALRQTTAKSENEQAAQEVKNGPSEAPVPHPFHDRERFFAHLMSDIDQAVLKPAFQVPGASFTVQCNACGCSMPDTHWHCSSCDEGDYDLCNKCFESGVHCSDEDHFLIKRTIENGKVLSSKTSIAPKKAPQPDVQDLPGAFTESKEDASDEATINELTSTRTCNCCIRVYSESEFVTCLDCKDYDLCIQCHLNNTHGHHPGHTFQAVTESGRIPQKAVRMCSSGRNASHWAICDGCDKYIFGVRHKCFICPDFDYCSTCVKTANFKHPGHRFAPLYEPIDTPHAPQMTHFGITCDGPLCKSKSPRKWISGVRYKCAICHDTDFCASCEALPVNGHNRTHPLIKFKTPVRNCTVNTFGETNGGPMPALGDRVPQTISKSTETTPAKPSANAATQVQTVAEVEPAQVAEQEPEPEVAGRAKEVVVAEEPDCKVEPKEVKLAIPTPELHAHFVRDVVQDGTKLAPRARFQQIWIMRNPGPAEWPAGCSVRYHSGDGMLNLDTERPGSTDDLDRAMQSNVLEVPVPVGEEVHFAVTLKAPARTGKAISYWRLRTTDGVAFGHRLWCDIDVVDSLPSTPYVTKPAAEPTTAESQMIFPKLDKESPESSTHIEEPTFSPVVTEKKDETTELGDDLEDLELEAESTDDGFMTDEEYEILEAEGDQEAVNGKK